MNLLTLLNLLLKEGHKIMLMLINESIGKLQYPCAIIDYRNSYTIIYQLSDGI